MLFKLLCNEKLLTIQYESYPSIFYYDHSQMEPKGSEKRDENVHRWPGSFAVLICYKDLRV